MTSKTTWVAALVVLVTFLFGVAVGVFTAHMMILYHRERMGDIAAHAMVRRLDRALDLTDAQRTRVEQIVDRHHDRINAVWSSVRPRVRAEIEQANREIEQVLTPEQRAKFVKMRIHLAPR